MPNRVKSLLPAVLADIRPKLSEQSFNTWFSNLEIVETSDTEVSLGVANLFVKRWLEEHYRSLLEECFARHLGKPVAVQVVIDGARFRAMRQHQTLEDTETSPEAQPSVAPPSNATAPRRPATPQGPPLPPNMTLEHFVEGPENRIALAAARRVVESPGDYSPLVLWGNHGQGKTHLLQAIRHAAADHEPPRETLYTTGEAFAHDYVAAVQGKRLDAFRRRFRSLDILLVDEMQILGQGNKNATLAEFLHIFDVLAARGAQIVVALDGPPEEAKGIPDKLRNRLCGGLTARLAPPEQTTRTAILAAKAKRRNVPLPADVLSYLARTVTGSVRELEGAVGRLAAVHQLTGVCIDRESAHAVLAEDDPNRSRRPTVERVIKAAAAAFKVEPDELRGRRRAKTIRIARQAAMQVARAATSKSLSEIGQAFGGRSHSTVLTTLKSARDTLLGDPLVTRHLRHMLEALGLGCEPDAIFDAQTSLFDDHECAKSDA